MRFLVLIVLSLPILSFNVWQDLTKVRTEYTAAADSKKITERNIAYLEGFKADALSNGYRGAYTMIMAKHAINPVVKLRWFKSGKQILEQAIAAAPKNAELRFLRLSVQINVPSILNYSGSIKKDREYLISNFDDLKSSVVRTNAAALIKKSGSVDK